MPERSKEEAVHRVLTRRKMAFMDCGISEDYSIWAAKASVDPVEIFRQNGFLELVARSLEVIARDITRQRYEYSSAGVNEVINDIAMSRL